MKKLIDEHYPDLKEKIESEQYQLADWLISFKLKNNLTQKEVAILGLVDYQTYLEYEACDITKSVEDYQKLIKRIEMNYNFKKEEERNK